MAKKSLGTLVCELAQFQSFIGSLNLLTSCKIHFTPDAIEVHSTESANIAFTVVTYKTKVETPLSIMIDLPNLRDIKGDTVQIYSNPNMITFHDDGLSYNCVARVDPQVESRDRACPEVKWPHVSIQLDNSQIKKLLTMIKPKNKYDITLSEGTFDVVDATDNDRTYSIEVESTDTYSTRVHGQYLSDILLAPKHFTGCEIKLGNDTPFVVSYACEWLDVKYLVAPMIDKDT